MPIKAVIFDLDGTLVDFNIDFRAVRAEVMHFLTNHGFPASLFSINESTFKMLEKIEIFLRNSGRGNEEFSKMKHAVYNILAKYELEAARRTSLQPGVLEALKNLKALNLKLAVCTVNGQSSTNHILETFRLKDFFDVVVTRELTPKVKPNPAHLEVALKTLNVKPTEALVVGDSVIDMACGRESKVTAVGVATGVSSQEELSRAGAAYVINSLTQLPSIITQVNAKEDV
ncbi:MAG: HAD family hydrolase [Candidatus Bathyarchaeia archaeon]